MGKIIVRYAGGCGNGIRFDILYRDGGNNREDKGVTPQYVSDFIRSHKGCKLDTSDLNGPWPKRFSSAMR